jgi:hypothetical protein
MNDTENVYVKKSRSDINMEKKIGKSLLPCGTNLLLLFNFTLFPFEKALRNSPEAHEIIQECEVTKKKMLDKRECVRFG